MSGQAVYHLSKTLPLVPSSQSSVTAKAVTGAETTSADASQVVEQPFLAACSLVMETSGCDLADAAGLVAAKAPALYDRYLQTFRTMGEK